jgi:16S rRNA (guanine1207-N2)-methyltransferase
MDRLELADIQLNLSRPGAQGRGLKAWDAADEQLIERARELGPGGGRVAVIDDNFGALTLALHTQAPVILADSATLDTALALNSRNNAVAAATVQSWLAPPAGHFDLVVMRIPRQTDYLEYLLRWVNRALSAGGRLLAAGMIKHLPGQSADVFHRLVQTERVHPARKKARLIECRGGQSGLEEWARRWQGYIEPRTRLTVDGLPAVFARARLDIGTRLLLPAVLAQAGGLPAGARVLDLACGNGLLGLAALSVRADLDVAFSDVSSQAVASVRHNLKTNFPGRAAASYHCDGVPAINQSYDLIVLNPPFHEGGAVGDHIALRLFAQASRWLQPGGRVLVVGNRHLGYHRSLRRWFRHLKQLQADAKFVVFEAGL